MHEYDCTIIGAGLFGSIIERTLAREGMSVLLMDSAELQAGSKPAACLIKPSWISGLGKEVCEKSLALLDELYGLEKIQFQTGAIKSPVFWIDPRKIRKGFVQEKVESLSFWRNLWTINNGYVSRNVIIAAGIWSNEVLSLLPPGVSLPRLNNIPALSPKTGVAFRANGKIAPRISLWRPYHQLTTFNIEEDVIWTGDSAGYKSYTTRHLKDSWERCAKYIEHPYQDLTPTVGHRPYIKGLQSPAYLEKHAPNLWVVTGGAKNGTIAAGWAAYELVWRIK